MIADWDKVDKLGQQARKLFSPLQKRLVAAAQQYRCVGVICQGQKLLPGAEWELDHVIPLWQGGTNDFEPQFDGKVKGNLQMLCASCHRRKTNMERMNFYAEQRKRKYGNLPKIPEHLVHRIAKKTPTYPICTTREFFGRTKSQHGDASASHCGPATGPSVVHVSQDECGHDAAASVGLCPVDGAAPEVPSLDRFVNRGPTPSRSASGVRTSSPCAVASSETKSGHWPSTYASETTSGTSKTSATNEEALAATTALARFTKWFSATKKAGQSTAQTSVQA